MPDRHSAIWAAIDTIASEHGYSPSGLARAAGLDATSFNPSKREDPAGNQRWPSTETIDLVLTVTGRTWAEFGRLVDELHETRRNAGGCNG